MINQPKKVEAQIFGKRFELETGSLAKQANEIQDRVKVLNRIFVAQINYEPDIGKIYFLYSKENGDDVLSMMALVELGKSGPCKSFLAKIRL